MAQDGRGGVQAEAIAHNGGRRVAELVRGPFGDLAAGILSLLDRSINGPAVGVFVVAIARLEL